jgi:DNA replication protein DnaC
MQQQFSNMMIFEKFKTGDPFRDAIIFTIVMSAITFISKRLSEYLDIIRIFSVERLIHIFHTKNVVEYEGKITCSTGVYTNELCQSSLFSDRFKALWEHINKSKYKESQIRSIKEQTSIERRTPLNDGFYMVNQYEKFLVSKPLDIYAYTHVISTDDSSEKKDDKPKNKIERIVIELFSYTCSIETIKTFVEDITKKYLSDIEELRSNKRFIYTLSNIKYEDCPCERWDESVFESTRTFKNLFFEGKSDVLEKVNFFLENKEWYYNIGIPYSLGIGLHGPPGTGKTSLIKALANYTKRHIVTISLKLIKTKKHLDAVFFENRYNTDNKKKSIGFDSKIIVFEDIDCIGDIVMDRSKKKESKLATSSVHTLNVEGVDITTIPKITVPMEDPPLTLDDILNLWDGIRETPGRIMVISSNHYADLDPALKRPGRIDITMELSFATRKTIGEMYSHLFGAVLEESVLQDVNDKFYSPAEIINIYLNSEQNVERFVAQLLKNEHV